MLDIQEDMKRKAVGDEVIELYCDVYRRGYDAGFNCRRYDNHILYNISKAIIAGEKGCFFSVSDEVDEVMELYCDVYRRGYDAGWESRDDQSERDRDASYQRGYDQGIEQGRNQAWEAAGKLVSMDYRERYKVLGNFDSPAIFVKNTASEAIEKLKAWEQKKKRDSDDICVGDEVRTCDGQLYTVVSISVTNNICGIDERGFWVTCDRDYVVRTERHFDEIEQILEKMKEGEHDHKS